MKTQLLTCRECGDTWERVAQRGRPPVVCSPCRNYYAVIRPTRKPSTPSLILTDGGRSKEGLLPVEDNDCTVRCLATATNSPYSVAHAFMAANGRKRNRGCPFATILAKHGHNVLGHTFTPTSIYKSRGINSLLRNNQALRRGTWVLQMRHHVATLRNGQLLDGFDSSRKDVRNAWRVT